MDGVYHVDFSSTLGYGSGTIFLNNGRLLGGDAAVAYMGSYTAKGAKITATVKIIKHGAGFSILGEATGLTFSGKMENGRIKGLGRTPANGPAADICLTKIMEA